MLGAMLVFVPLAPADLAAWASGDDRAGRGFAATPGFLRTFGIARGDDEDADLTLLEIAALDGLLHHGVRIVAVCDTTDLTVDDSADAEADFGAVTLPPTGYGRVTSLFTDDADGAALAASVRDQVAGLNLPDAWDAEATRPLLADVDLLWHSSTEWERLSH